MINVFLIKLYTSKDSSLKCWRPNYILGHPICKSEASLTRYTNLAYQVRDAPLYESGSFSNIVQMGGGESTHMLKKDCKIGGQTYSTGPIKVTHIKILSLSFILFSAVSSGFFDRFSSMTYDLKRSVDLRPKMVVRSGATFILR